MRAKSKSGAGTATSMTSARLRRFCEALHFETERLRARRPVSGIYVQWWASIDTVARRMGIPHDEAIVLADDCAKAGLVRHDAVNTKGRLPHSVSLRLDR